MKKCPYCAEEIQDHAIKCKHCNEWLIREIDKNSSRDHPQVIQESEIVRSKRDSVAKTPKILEETISLNSTECPIKPKKQMKMKIYGWGWLLFLFIYATFHNPKFAGSHFYSPITALIDDLLIVPLLVVYFLFRTMFLKKMKHKPGLKAGLLTFSIWFVLLFPMTIWDSSMMKSTLAAVNKKYSSEKKKLVEKEKKLVSFLIQAPKSVEDFRYNAERIGEYLVLAEQKRTLATEMLNDLKEIYEKSEKNRESNLKSITQLHLLIDRRYETSKKALEALKKYYLTGNESFFNEYSTLNIEADRLKDEYQRISKDILSE